jgi:hypothetical protein
MVDHSNVPLLRVSIQVVDGTAHDTAGVHSHAVRPSELLMRGRDSSALIPYSIAHVKRQEKMLPHQQACF